MKEKIKAKETNINKKKVIIFILVVLALTIFICFFIKNNYKNQNIGNNMSNKNIEEIEEYILNISSYNATIEVEVQSNKNTNKYVLQQKCAEQNIKKQIVKEPSNIAGLETIYDGNNLKINNTKLNLSTIYENYPYVADNFLWIDSFIEDYKNAIEKGKQKIREEDEIIIMEVNNTEKSNKKLYIDKKSCKPIKMLIQDINQNIIAYILYNEIEINSLKRDDVLAFKIQKIYIEQY